MGNPAHHPGLRVRSDEIVELHSDIVTEGVGIWLDEEPPLDVYGECLIRTATTNGIIMLTFTPLEGLSDTVLQFQPHNN